MATAGIIVAGGRSTRMGSPKALLEWHGSTLARRVAGLVARAVDGPIVVVRSVGQDLPELPAGVLVVDDDRDGLGPLQGIASGLAAVQHVAEAAFVSAVDVPFLSPHFVQWVVDCLVDGVDIVVPHVGGYRHPLAACYRTSVLPEIEALLAGGDARPELLFERCPTLWRDDDAVREIDPDFASLRNLNDPEDYAPARAQDPPTVFLNRREFEHVPGRVVEIAAATLGVAAQRAGLHLGPRAVVILNGTPVPTDPELPLVDDDLVTVFEG